jgi:putative nucleotidyltransferase with HDIG domain
MVSIDGALDQARQADSSGDWDEALRFYQTALEAAQHQAREQRPMLLRKIGRVHFERGSYELANRAFQESLISAQEEKQRTAAAAALNSMAACAQFRGRLDVAESLYGRASVLAEEAGDVRLCALIDQNLGTLASTRGDMSAALMRYQSSLERFQRLNDDRASAWVLNNMGKLHVSVGEFAEAGICFDSAQVLAKSIGDPASEAKIETNRAELYLKRQTFELARDCCDRAFTIFSRIGSDSGLCEVYKAYGVLYHETGKPGMAQVQLTLALKLARACEHPLLEAEIESQLARVFLAAREHRQAIRSLNRAYELFRELDARREILDLKRRLERISEVYFRAAELWVEDTPGFRAQRTAQRGKRVAEFALALAQEVDYPETVWLRLGAYLHDVGNSAIPADVLSKPGPLTDSERAAIRRHPVIGDEILEELSFPAAVRPIVRNHHERWDGTGYPDGLRGEAIPLSARIVCIADIYDALTTESSYRPAYTSAESLEIMQAEAGKTVDPSLFRVFDDLARRGVLETVRPSDTRVRRS